MAIIEVSRDYVGRVELAHYYCSEKPPMNATVPTSQELFRNQGLLVRKVSTGSQICVVTFVPYVNANEKTLDRAGFGQGFLRARRIDGIHVICHENKWFHDPEIFEALGQIRKYISDYDRVVTYGSSMGGYAAIRLAGWIGANDAIAFSPQFSIQRSICPFEGRWRNEIDRISFVPEIERAAKLSGRAYLFYDPHDPGDHCHAKMYAAEYPVCLVPLPDSGHSAATFLNKNGLLVPTVLDVVFDRFDAQALILRAQQENAAGQIIGS